MKIVIAIYILLVVACDCSSLQAVQKDMCQSALADGSMLDMKEFQDRRDVEAKSFSLFNCEIRTYGEMARKDPQEDLCPKNKD